MKVSAFYAMFFRRQNWLRDLFLNIFFVICSWPRLLLEVFLRRKMGERYFSLTAVILLFAVLCRIPSLETRYGENSLWGPFTLWYVFAFAFLGMGIYRKVELWRLPQTFDFQHFSLSTGTPWPQLQSVTIQGKTTAFSPRVVSTLIEPGVAVVVGLLLWFVLGQALGLLLINSGVIYSLSYVASYQQGKDFLLDQIDQQICQQSLGETMAEGLAPDFSRGVEFPGELPTDPALRKQLAPAFLDEETAYPVR